MEILEAVRSDFVTAELPEDVREVIAHAQRSPAEPSGRRAPADAAARASRPRRDGDRRPDPAQPADGVHARRQLVGHRLHLPDAAPAGSSAMLHIDGAHGRPLRADVLRAALPRSDARAGSKAPRALPRRADARPADARTTARADGERLRRTTNQYSVRPLRARWTRARSGRVFVRTSRASPRPRSKTPRRTVRSVLLRVASRVRGSRLLDSACDYGVRFLRTIQAAAFVVDGDLVLEDLLDDDLEVGQVRRARPAGGRRPSARASASGSARSA